MLAESPSANLNPARSASSHGSMMEDAESSAGHDSRAFIENDVTEKVVAARSFGPQNLQTQRSLAYHLPGRRNADFTPLCFTIA